MDTKYIAKKLFQCKELVKNAISEAQKEIYQEYLEFWQEKAKNIKIHSHEPEPEIEVIIKPEDDDWEVKEAANFKVKFPDKKAYYKRDGVVYKTRAFTEFLKSK